MRHRGAVAGLLPALLVAACGIDVASSDDPHGGADAGVVAPSLAEVTPLADPRAWSGDVQAVAADQAVDPVTDRPEPELPVTVTDAQGTEVTVSDVSRILALDVYGTLARTVFELGLGDNVVGRDVSTQFEEARDLPLVTHDGHDLAAEAILEADPSVIVTDTSLGPWDVVLQMRDAGIPVVVVESERGLDRVGDLTREIATALGVPDEGERLAKRTQRELDAAVDRIADVAPDDLSGQLRTLFLYVRGQSGIYYLFGEESGADSLIDALGLYDVAEEIGWNGMRPITDEALVAAQPDLVLMMSGGLESAGGVDGLLERLPALANTPAGENERFVHMADSQILGFGPETAAVLEALAVAVYAPEAVS
ncbi:ABC transporter substrate-binding protein [Nocardioides sp. TF02-7]|uniref:heme/hemin ABC transporter substrate-binding protein n=1 Tax=Nocardioides sp. TF02-7 TaxID=2917724 RepID=UPI001F058C12|nr:ABC transporter substrate-binding protein [Nocardioides sp. TF02-7]UMG93275.1 ABC transporter substrate-binding protein [Nocardioides sp. TF02-7]